MKSVSEIKSGFVALKKLSKLVSEGVILVPNQPAGESLSKTEPFSMPPIFCRIRRSFFFPDSWPFKIFLISPQLRQFRMAEPFMLAFEPNSPVSISDVVRKLGFGVSPKYVAPFGAIEFASSCCSKSVTLSPEILPTAAVS